MPDTGQAGSGMTPQSRLTQHALTAAPEDRAFNPFDHDQGQHRPKQATLVSENIGGWGSAMTKMKATIFVEPGRIALDEKPIPDIGPLDALVRITTTTICGTDVHILKGEYPVAPGLTIGHEPVGIIEKLGSAVQGFEEGQRVIAGAITPSGHSMACLCGCHSQDGAGT